MTAETELTVHSLPPSLRRLLNRHNPVAQAQLDALRSAGEAWWKNHAEVSDYNQEKFLSAVREAIQTQGITQAQLARAWGKSRQYVSRLLGTKSISSNRLTLRTITALCVLVGVPFTIQTNDGGN